MEEKKLEKRKNLEIIVLVVIIAVLLRALIYLLFINKDDKLADNNGRNQVIDSQQTNTKDNECNCPKCEECKECDKCKECENTNNVDTGITVYQNGKVTNLSAMKSLKGKYQGYDNDKKNNEYIIISDKISECEISNITHFGGTTSGKREIIAVKMYLFSNWRHMEKDNVIDSFIVEFSIKEDGNVRNYMFFGVSTNDGFEIHPLSNSETLFYSLSN